MPTDSKNRKLFHAAHYNILAAQIREKIAEVNGANRDYSADELAIQKAMRSTLANLSIDLAKRLKYDNELFDPIRFLDACSPDPEMYPLSELWSDDE